MLHIKCWWNWHLEWRIELLFPIAVVAVLQPVFGFGDDGSGGERDRFPGVNVVGDQLVDGGKAVVLELEEGNKKLLEF